MSIPSIDQLKRAVQISEQIERLEADLDSILGNQPIPRTKSSNDVEGPSGRQRRTMSPEAREKIAAAQRRRWAKSKGQSSAAKSSSKPAKKSKGGITPEGRAKLAAAMKARWAARKKGAPTLNAKK